MRSKAPRMGLANVVSRGSLVAPQVVLVLKSGNTISIRGISTPFAISREKPGNSLVRSSGTGVALANVVSRGSLVAPKVVLVLMSGNSISIRGISTPLAISREKPGNSLVRSSGSGVALANVVSRGSLVAPQVVLVLMSGNAIDSIAPLAITMSNSISNSGHSNFRGNNARVALADSISRRSLVSPQVVAVLKGGNSKSVTI